MEMIHTYSLIHDDLPAMDDDDYRRGKLTNHKVYGAGMATLAGDALLTLAFEVMLRQQGVSAEKLVQVVREISTAAGPDGMVGGQALDMESEDKQISMETMKNIHLGKTGALFRAAIRSGAILGGASEDELQALTVYADNFGLAFQITDDILDVIGDEQVIGKPVGSDEKNHKSTYVTLTSLEEAQKLAQEAVDTAIDALKIFGEEADFLRELVAFLVKRNK
jgi:geranylgeranyl diphosphate synthase type II